MLSLFGPPCRIATYRTKAGALRVPCPYGPDGRSSAGNNQRSRWECLLITAGCFDTPATTQITNSCCWNYPAVTLYCGTMWEKRFIVKICTNSYNFLCWFTRGLIHRHCHKIYLRTCLRTIATQKLRYLKMILRHVLSEFTELVLNDRMICHTLRYVVSVLWIRSLS